MTAGVNATHTMVVNYLSTDVSDLPEYISKDRNVSAFGKDKSYGRREKTTIYNINKSIKTSYIPGWHNLSKANQENVKAKHAQKWSAWKTGQSNKDDAATYNCMK